MMQDANAKDNTGSFANISKEFSRATDVLGNLAQSTQNVYNLANSLDRLFLTSKTRMDEMMLAFSNTIPQVSRLGGSITDVGQTIVDIAKASRRNVIENEETIAKLYATSKVLGQIV
jgi:methyl-accepting chemotaxis protein